MNLPLAKLSAVQDREADVFDKTLYTTPELILLAGRFTNATKAIESARAIQDFNGLTSAYRDLNNIIAQADRLLIGVRNAIQVEQERRK